MLVTLAGRSGEGRRQPGALVAIALAIAVGSGGCAATAPTAPPTSSGPVAASSSLPRATAAAPTSSGPSPTPVPRGVPVSTPAGPVSATAERSLRLALTTFLRRTGTPGVSATIRWPDGRTWTGTAGFADVARRTPVTAATAFAVASVSKTFTAALVLQLVGEGRIGLDQPAARYIPDQKLDPRITVRMLLDHTSGLFDVFLAPGIDRALQGKPSARWTLSRTLGYLRRPYFPPGRGWHYSNTNYLLLALIAARVTHRPLVAEIRRRFLDPLGLDRTWLQADEAARASLAHGYVVAGTRAKRTTRDLSDGSGVAPFRSVITALDGAGSIAATSGDLAAWAADLYDGRVLSASLLAAALDDQHRTTAYIPGVRYGLGVQLYDVGGRPTLGHSGRVLGFRGQMRYLPTTGISIAILTNQSRVDVAPLVASLLAVVLPPPVPDWVLIGRRR